MSADIENKRSFWRKPSSRLWIATAVVILDAVWGVVVSILTATGHLLGNQNIECGDFLEFAPRVQNEAKLVYLWTSFTLLACVLMLFEFWRRHGHYVIMVVVVSFVLVIGMCWSLGNLAKKENEEIQSFKQRYLARMLVNGKQIITKSDCDIITNLHRWQTEFKCCGFESYQDWRGSIPASCLCDEDDDMSGCISLGNNSIHDKPCLPTVLSLVNKRSSLFWIITIIWITISAIPTALYSLFCIGSLITLLYICCEFMQECDNCSCNFWREKTVPVVFIGKNNNNQTDEDEEEEEENWKHKEGSKDGNVALDMGDGLNEEGEAAELVNPVKMIPLSLLSRLQEELDPPPVQHWVTNEPCLCILPPPRRTKKFYTVLIEEGSPLLPSDAVLVDANKPMKICYWDKGHRSYDCRKIVWPKAKELPIPFFDPPEQIPTDDVRS